MTTWFMFCRPRMWQLSPQCLTSEYVVCRTRFDAVIRLTLIINVI
jgi:hypothetical protein